MINFMISLYTWYNQRFFTESIAWRGFLLLSIRMKTDLDSLFGIGNVSDCVDQPFSYFCIQTDDVKFAQILTFRVQPHT